jgi:hypothetical protein
VGQGRERGGQLRCQRPQPEHRRSGKKLTALLDAQAGIEFEGEAAPQYDADSRLAIKAWNYLACGPSAIDWAGVPIVAELLGIEDLEGLLHRLLVIKTHSAHRD